MASPDGRSVGLPPSSHSVSQWSKQSQASRVQLQPARQFSSIPDRSQRKRRQAERLGDIQSLRGSLISLSELEIVSETASPCPLAKSCYNRASEQRTRMTTAQHSGNDGSLTALHALDFDHSATDGNVAVYETRGEKIDKNEGMLPSSPEHSPCLLRLRRATAATAFGKKKRRPAPTFDDSLYLALR